MKKLLTLIFLSIISSNQIYAEITWSLSDDGTLTISGTDMPDYYDYYDDIAAPWHSQRDIIKKVIIENGVTKIGSCAFRNCSNLSLIIIPKSVTSIGYSAFSGCSSLTSITIPNSVTNIESNTFYRCSSFTSITIPNSVTKIVIALSLIVQVLPQLLSLTL